MYCTSPLCIIHAMEQMSRSEGRTQDFKIALRPGRKKCGKRSSLTALWCGATRELLGAHTQTHIHTHCSWTASGPLQEKHPVLPVTLSQEIQ